MIAKLVSQQMSEGVVKLGVQLSNNGPGNLFAVPVVVAASINEYVEGSYEISIVVSPKVDVPAPHAPASVGTEVPADELPKGAKEIVQ